MFNRSPRFGIKFPKSTPPEVGPYTYMLEDPFLVKRVNVVPFASTAERKSAIINTKFTESLYNVQGDRNVIGGHSLRNKAKRFVYKCSDIPPPGTYRPKWPEKRKQPPSEPPPGKGRIYFCKVPFSSLGSAPSIPTKKDAEGYDIDNLGRLIKMAHEAPCKPPGPATYHVDSPSNTNPYFGCRWSHRTSKRSPQQIIEGPSPASYVIEKATCRNDLKEQEFREMARRFAYLPRFSEEQQGIAMRNNYPSPCQYQIPSSFQFKRPVTTVVKPFISRNPRFQEWQTNDIQIYDVTKSFTCKPSPSVKAVPFGVAGRRFKLEKKSDAGSGLIRLKGFADELMAKHCKRITLFHPPFNSTAPRNISFDLNDSDLKTSCSFYPREEHVVRTHKMERGHSVFLSTTERGSMKFSEAPSVSSYDVSSASRRLNNKISHNKKKLPFMATDKRRTVVLPQKDNPGPADYLGKKGIEDKGYYFNRSDRFEYRVSDGPLPGHYHIHPLYGESIYKAKNTFNLDCAESVLKKKLKLAPKDTYKTFVNTLKKKKQLRCFTSLLESNSKKLKQ